MKQNIIAVDVQYVFGSRALIDEFNIEDHVRRIETSVGKKTFAIKIFYKDDTITSFVFANKTIVMVRVHYSLVPRKDRTCGNG